MNDAADMAAFVRDNAKTVAQCGENLMKGCQGVVLDALERRNETVRQATESAQALAESVSAAAQGIPSVKSVSDAIKIQTQFWQAASKYQQTLMKCFAAEGSKAAETPFRLVSAMLCTAD